METAARTASETVSDPANQTATTPLSDLDLDGNALQRLLSGVRSRARFSGIDVGFDADAFGIPDEEFQRFWANTDPASADSPSRRDASSHFEWRPRGRVTCSG